MEQQQQQPTTLGYLKSARRALHETETMGADNLDLLAAQRETLISLAKKTEAIHQRLNESEQKITEMEHPWSLWTRKAKLPSRDSDASARYCNNRTGTIRTWRMKGYLHKRTRWSKKWKTRYCILDGEVLHYYKSEKQILAKPRGTIVLTGAVITEHTYNDLGRDNCFSVTVAGAHHKVLFECFLPADYMTWITHLRKAAGVAKVPVMTVPDASNTSSSLSVVTAAQTSVCDVTASERDEVLDHILHSLDNIDVISRVMQEELDDQNDFLRYVTNSVVNADIRVRDDSRRVRAICV